MKPIEAPDAEITAAIAAMAQSFDEFTADHFEDENALTLEMDVRHPTRSLVLPKRVRTVTSVVTVDSEAAETIEDATTYRVRSSLDAAGAVSVGLLDSVEIIPGQRLSTGDIWPVGPRTVKVTGDFSWLVTPDRVKRAVALMVYDHFKPEAGKLRRAERLSTPDMTVLFADTEPTGIPEVDGIIEEFTRKKAVVV